ncbi:MAG TPA: hypothetical protein PLN31_03375 [Azoarcus taiwanensis]|nr:hypothetical protein [Azoarcus taiwanensis]
MNRNQTHDQDATCDCCGRELLEDDYESQECLRIDFKAGYASVFGDGNTVRAVLCQHCVQKHLGPWLTIIEEPEGFAIPQVCRPKRGYQPYQLRERGAAHGTEVSGLLRDHEGGLRGRTAHKLWDIPVWMLMVAAGALLVLFFLISATPQFERAQLVLTPEGCLAMAAHGVAIEPLPDSTLCRISGLYDHGKLASKTATIRLTTESGPIDVRLSHAQIVSHANQ